MKTRRPFVVLALVVMSALVAHLCWNTLRRAAADGGGKTAAAARDGGSAITPGPAATVEPAATAVPRTADVPAAFATAPELARREQALDDPAATARVRLLRTALKYPLVRVEERLRRENGGERVTARTAMAAGHVVVHYDAAAAPELVEAALAGIGTPLRRMPRQRAILLALPEPGLDSVPQALAAIRALPGLHAEPDYLVHALASPNDPLYADGTLWGMHNTGQSSGTDDKDIDAPEGWNTRSDAGMQVVAVIDSGVRLTHQDLAANLWTNPGEISGNGIDDDTNGYIDDVHGFNAITGSGDPSDDNKHGTHCAGTIAGRGNNGLGVSGVAWTARIMALKFLNADGSGFTSDAAECVTYAATMGARVLSNSWGGGGYSELVADAIAQARDADAVFVAAAGNDGNNTDRDPVYPANYPIENVVSVAAYDRTGARAWFSNYGVAGTHIAAPGVAITSCGIASDADYLPLNGTSMACPHVAGVLALARAQFPGESALQSINRVLNSADRSILQGSVVSGGVNLAGALAGAPTSPFNDAFANARDLGTRSISALGNNQLATKEAGEPNHAGTPGGTSVWFKWTASFSRDTDFQVTGADFDAVVAVYTGTSVSALTPLGSANGTGNDAGIRIPVTAGQTVYIAVDGVGGAAGSFTLGVSSKPPNDDFANARVLDPAGGTISDENSGATKQVGEPRHGGLFGGSSLWYRWTAPQTGRLEVTRGAASSAPELGIGIYSGADVASLTTLASTQRGDDPNPVASLLVSAGQTVFIGVDTPDGTEASFFLQWSFASNTIAFQSAEITVAETAGSVSVPVDRFTATGAGACAVSWFTSSGNEGALPGTDFTAASGTLDWSAGESATRQIQIPILDNSLVQGSREFYISLTNPTNGAYLGAITRVKVTITDDDLPALPPGAVAYAFAASSVNGTAGDSAIGVRILRAGDLAGAGSVRATTRNGTLAAGTHFTALDETVAFAPGERIRDVVVALGPTSAAGNFHLDLSDASGASDVVSTPTATLTLAAGDSSGMAIISRASTGSGGEEISAGVSIGSKAEISANGRFLAFRTTAALDAGDRNGGDDAYLKDRWTGAVTLASRDRAGLAAGVFGNPALSDDGRLLVFCSASPDLVGGDTNGKRDVFIFDRATGGITRASLNSNGEQAAIQYINLDEPQYTHCDSPAISADGKVVAFVSDATNLDTVRADTDWDADVFVRVPATGVTEIVSVGDSWEMWKYAAGEPALDADGSRVAFIQATAQKPRLHVRDRASATTYHASTSSTGTASDGWGLFHPVLSADGAKVAFDASATNLAPGDTSEDSDVFLKTLASGEIIVVSTKSGGGALGGYAAEPSLDAGARYVAFRYDGSDAVAGDNNSAGDVLVKDLQTGGLYLASRTSAGAVGNGASFLPVLSSDASQLAFTSSASDLVAGDTNAAPDIFAGPNPALGGSVSIGWSASGFLASKAASPATLTLERSGDTASAVWVDVQTRDGTARAGRDYVAVTTRVQFAAGTTTGLVAIPLLDLAGPDPARALSVSIIGLSPGVAPGGLIETTLTLTDPANTTLESIVRATDSTGGTYGSQSASISADGRYVVFDSYSPDLVAGDTNDCRDVFLLDRQTGQTTLVSKTSAGTLGDDNSIKPVISADGSTVAFASKAGNLGPGSAGGYYQVLVKNLATGVIERASSTSGGAAGTNDSGVDPMNESTRPSQIALSADGTKVVFASLAPNLVTGDTNSKLDIFLRDRTAGTITRVSVKSNGSQAGGGIDGATMPSIDEAGTKVAFIADFTDLVSGDTNGKADVFVRTLASGAVLKPYSTAANGDADTARLSGDGSLLVFSSLASNLVTGDTNTLEDLFACPAGGGAVQRLSISSSGGQSQKVTGIFTEGGASIAGYPSRDGRYVVFQSNGTGLVPGVQMPTEDFFGTLYPAPNNKLYVRDRVANTTTAIIPVSAASEGSLPVLSADGAIVAFHSPSGILAVGDTNGRDDIFLAPNPAMAAPAPVSYAAWVTAHPAAADPYADSDHDGLTNFAEFALGLDPFTADAAGATSIDHDPMPTFSYTIDTLAAAEVTAMTSTNLADWTPVLATDATYSATGLPDDFREITLQWTGANAQRRFFRLDIASD